MPAGATFAGRLVDDRSTVTAGMPIVSAKLVGYGIVAEIDCAQAYRISDALGSVQAQIKNGPGPFPCTVLGTIAALPAGTIPEPPRAGPERQRQTVRSGQPAAARRRTSRRRRARVGADRAAAGLHRAGHRQADQRRQRHARGGHREGHQRAGRCRSRRSPATQGKGKVDVIGPDRRRQTKDVVLGLTDGKVIQIKSGLTGTETLAVPGPDLPPGKPAGDEAGDVEGPR